MAFDNTLYIYEVQVESSAGEKGSFTGHAPTAGLARKSAENALEQRKNAGLTETVTKFLFNGEERPVSE